VIVIDKIHAERLLERLAIAVEDSQVLLAIAKHYRSHQIAPGHFHAWKGHLIVTNLRVLTY